METNLKKQNKKNSFRGNPTNYIESWAVQQSIKAAIEGGWMDGAAVFILR